MKAFLRSWLGPIAVTVLLSVALTKPCVAARWQELGNANGSLDKIYIDADSVEQVDGFRIVMLMTVYPSKRVNQHNITMDSRVQKTAFDCANKKFLGIRMIGYLDGQQVGTGPEATDWKTKLIPVPNDSFSQRILTTACSLPLSGGASPKIAPIRLPHNPKQSFHPALESSLMTKASS
jgi:ABC-type transporter Mla MlaB component